MESSSAADHSPIWRGLPPEIAIAVMEHAGEQFLARDRPTLVNLALTSRIAYTVVAPFLYRVVALKCYQTVRFHDLLRSPETRHLAARVLRHTRVFVSHPDESQWDRIDLAVLLLQVHTIKVTFSAIRTLARLAASESVTSDGGGTAAVKCTLRHMHVWYSWFTDILDTSPAFRSHLTRVCGFRMTDNMFAGRQPAHAALEPSWVKAVINALPALTHFGIEIIRVNARDPAANIEAIKNSFCDALGYNRVQVVAVRVAGPAGLRPPGLALVLRQFCVWHTKLAVWEDVRDIDSWDKEAKATVDDAWAGRSIWTEARNLAPGPQ